MSTSLSNPLGLQSQDACDDSSSLSSTNTVSTGSLAQSGCSVESVNGYKGVVELTTEKIPETGGKEYFTLDGLWAALAAAGDDPISIDVPNKKLKHATSGVVAGVYGSDTHYAVVTVDNKGHVIAIETKTLPSLTALTAGLEKVKAAGKGFQVRSSNADDNWVPREIRGTAGRISVNNPDGALGNPTIDLHPVAGVEGTYSTPLTFSVDEYGRITNVTPSIVPPAPPVYTGPTTLGELLNVNDDTDSPGAPNYILRFDGTEWVPDIIIPTISSTGFEISGPSVVLLKYDGAPDGIINEYQHIVTSGHDIIHYNLGVAVKRATIDVNFPATTQDFYDFHVGNIPESIRPKTRINIKFAALSVSSTNLQRASDSTALAGTQTKLIVEGYILPSGELFISGYSLDPGTTTFATLDGDDYLILLTSGSYVK